MSLWVYDFTYETRSNGPGVRNILHLSGCGIRCKGCFSPHTWDRNVGKEEDVASVAARLLLRNPEGISISGGEPLEQAESLLQLLHLLDKANLPKGVLMYSGTTDEKRAEIREWPEIRALLDAAVLGPYDREKALPRASKLVSSSNQRLELRGSKLTNQMFLGLPTVEIVMNGTELKLLGFPRRDDVSVA